MPLGRFLTHRVTIVRRVRDDDVEARDAYGQPSSADQVLASDVAVAITPRRATEQAADHQAGVAVSDHLVYFFPRDIATGDVIVHTAADCPMATDLPDGNYEVTSVPLGAGIGHHVEALCRRIDAEAEAIALSGS